MKNITEDDLFIGRQAKGLYLRESNCKELIFKDNTFTLEDFWK